MIKLESDKNLEKKVASILDIDDSIRFVGLLRNDGILLSHYTRKGMVPLLDTEESKKSYSHVVLRAASYRSMNKKLGRVLWNIELREKVKWMSLYLKNGNIIIISTEVSSNHDKIIKKILEKLSDLA